MEKQKGEKRRNGEYSILGFLGNDEGLGSAGKDKKQTS